MFGEKDLIFLGAALIKAASGGTSIESAVKDSVKLYKAVFKHVSDEDLREKYLEQTTFLPGNSRRITEVMLDEDGPF